MRKGPHLLNHQFNPSAWRQQLNFRLKKKKRRANSLTSLCFQAWFLLSSFCHPWTMASRYLRLCKAAVGSLLPQPLPVLLYKVLLNKVLLEHSQAHLYTAIWPTLGCTKYLLSSLLRKSLQSANVK